VTQTEEPQSPHRSLTAAEVQAGLDARAEAGGEQPASRRVAPRSSGAAPTRAGAPERVVADVVEIQRGGAGRVEAGDVSVRQGAIGFARAKEIEVEMGAVGAAIGSEIELERALTRFAAARDSITLEQSGALGVLANRVSLGRGAGVVFLFARKVEGDVRPVFDWRGGLAFGAAAGAVLAVVRALLGGRRR
jgi:hypothetical protein